MAVTYSETKLNEADYSPFMDLKYETRLSLGDNCMDILVQTPSHIDPVEVIIDVLASDFARDLEKTLRAELIRRGTRGAEKRNDISSDC